MARELCHLLRTLAMQVVEVPDAHAGRVAALPRRQVAAVRTERHARDGLARRAQHVALPVLAGVEQHYGASGNKTQQVLLQTIQKCQGFLVKRRRNRSGKEIMSPRFFFKEGKNLNN